MHSYFLIHYYKIGKQNSFKLIKGIFKPVCKNFKNY
jgi:hypothetical protein